VAIALLLLAACTRPAAGENRFPAFVYASALTLDSYRAAAALPIEVITRIPCYCGCVSPPDSHSHLRDCFYQADGTFSRHAAGCDLCGKIVLDVQQAHREGVALKSIRAMIDNNYAEFGPPTATPPVEG
jgi:hypothetical protein